MEIRLRIPGTPPQKNAKHRVYPIKRGSKVSIGRVNSPAFVRLCEKVALAWDRERARHKLKPALSGAWEIEVQAFWPTQRHLDLSFGRGDVDAPLECILDALQNAGAIDDDARIVRLFATKHHDKHHPRTEVVLREVTPLEGQLGLGVEEDGIGAF